MDPSFGGGASIYGREVNDVIGEELHLILCKNLKNKLRQLANSHFSFAKSECKASQLAKISLYHILQNFDKNDQILSKTRNGIIVILYGLLIKRIAKLREPWFDINPLHLELVISHDAKEYVLVRICKYDPPGFSFPSLGVWNVETDSVVPFASVGVDNSYRHPSCVMLLKSV
ncbi:hypothetical protein LguiB_026630 [Lonicera macranthoides]